MLMVMDEDHPPLFVNLAAELDKNGGILESLLVRLDIESLRRGLDLIKDHLDLVMHTELGKFWIKRLSQRVNRKWIISYRKALTSFSWSTYCKKEYLMILLLMFENIKRTNYGVTIISWHLHRLERPVNKRWVTQINQFSGHFTSKNVSNFYLYRIKTIFLIRKLFLTKLSFLLLWFYKFDILVYMNLCECDCDNNRKQNKQEFVGPGLTYQQYQLILLVLFGPIWYKVSWSAYPQDVQHSETRYHRDQEGSGRHRPL